MEKDQNPFPKIEVISLPERLCRIGRAIKDLGRHPFDEMYEYPLESDGIVERECPDVYLMGGPNQMTDTTDL